jgi:hypothetical protein
MIHAHRVEALSRELGEDSPEALEAKARVAEIL